MQSEATMLLPDNQFRSSSCCCSERSYWKALQSIIPCSCSSKWSCWVEGVSGIMSDYSSALQNFSLHGLTLFGEVINRAAQIAEESLHDQKKYFVLLIITPRNGIKCSGSCSVHCCFIKYSKHGGPHHVSVK